METLDWVKFDIKMPLVSEGACLYITLTKKNIKHIFYPYHVEDNSWSAEIKVV